MIRSETTPLLPAPAPAESTARNRLAAVAGRMDLIALITTLFGVAALAIVTILKSLIEIAGLIASLWHDPNYFWVVGIFAVAVVWVALRWKRLCVC